MTNHQNTTWLSRYSAPNGNDWQGRLDLPKHSCFFQIIKLLDLTQPFHAIQQPAFVFIGFCSEEGVRRNFGRTGAIEGPHAIREVLATFPIQRDDVFCYDAGDIVCRDGHLEAAQEALGEVVALLLKHNMIPIVFGGGHELAYGHYQGIAKQFPDEDLGIINIDAHFDMRELLQNNQGSSGTPFLQIAKAHQAAKRSFNYYCIGIQRTGNIQSLFTTAKNHHTKILFAEEMHDVNRSASFLDLAISHHQLIYLSICLDAFAASYAPGVSAPQVLGLQPWQGIPLIRQLVASKKVVSYDIAELCPKYDIDKRTAKLAASLVYEIIHHY
ncbi:MAG: formimidoylglutamase [Gammaproteobacteria bacterium RIFCSPHIGHO2_12_FULL_37_34]|nr:MAG: formimidoylglutamase [Gammaproteobacteria bacterium RIFCSPHIGHO2_12_FULL_37_34]